MKFALKKFVFIFVLALFGSIFIPLQINAQGVNQLIVNRMQRYKEALQSLKSDIEMTEIIAPFNDDTVKQGEVYYFPETEEKIFLRINWLKLKGQPYKETFIVANKEYHLFNPQTKQLISGKVSSAKKDISSKNNFEFISMSKAELKRNYEVKNLGNKKVDGEEVFHLELLPIAKKNYKKVELYITGDGFPFASDIYYVNGDRNVVKLYNTEPNITINWNLFKKPRLPKGFKEIKG